MLNSSFRLTPKDSSRSWLSWEAPGVDWVSWVFANGRHVVGPFYAGQASRSVYIPHPSGTTVAVEIHDLPGDTEPVDPVAVMPNTRPDILWNAVPEAERYRIYHREGDGAETLIYDEPAEEGLERHRVTCPVELAGRGGVWHFFRVEAVDNYANESTREAWTYFVMDLPAPAGELVITDGSAPGLFDFEIT
mgnify:CR=1 FL=1